MVAIPVVGVVFEENRIVSAFRAAGATARERATTTGALAIDEGMAFRTLCRHDILRDAGEQRRWLDEARWEAHEKTRHRFALRLITTVLLVLGAAFTWIALTKR